MGGAALKKSAVTSSVNQGNKTKALRVETVETPSRIREAIRINLGIARNAVTKEEQHEDK